MAVSRNINEMLENAFIDNIWMKKSAVKGFLSLCRKIEPSFCKDTLFGSFHWEGRHVI